MLTLVVVAHPDDESFGCGSILAHAAANGRSTAVLCATRGEAGESRIPTDDLATVREAELRTAARLLGVHTVVVLDHVDSGMDGPPPDRALVTVDSDVLVSDIRALIEELRPDVVVILAADDGHRDHVAIRDATLVAVDTSRHAVAATYLSCLARSSMARWADHMRTSGGGEAYLAMQELGTPDEDITLVVDVAAHLDTRWAAIRAHRSQASPFDDLDTELQHEFLASDRLRLVRGTAELDRDPGYHSVDEHPDVDLLLRAMDETARWEATRELRSWERTQLALGPGERLLDIGCGLGDAGLTLSVDLGTTGELVGVDGSDAMIAEATARARRPTSRTHFVVGDATAIDEPDDSFDAIRSERMLQWVSDPAAVVAEMARVVRPGGRVCLIDSDWSSFTLELGDPHLSAQIHAFYRVERNRPSNLGSRLATLTESAGLRPVAHTSATQVWSHWDPDTTHRLDGWVPMVEVVDELIAGGELQSSRRDDVLASIEDAARNGRFEMRLTMHAILAVAPCP